METQTQIKIKNAQEFKRYIRENYSIIFWNIGCNGRANWEITHDKYSTLVAEGSINFITNFAHVNGFEYFENAYYIADDVETENIIVDMIEAREINLDERMS